MSITYYNIRAPEMMWDIPRIISGQQNEQSGFAGSFKQSPTALLPAVWMLWNPSGANNHVWHISFSTDTAIYWQLYRARNTTSFTARDIENLSPFGPGANASFSADVVAAPAVVGNFVQGFAQPGVLIDVLQKSWIEPAGAQNQLVLATSAVAANCTANFHWTELG